MPNHKQKLDTYVTNHYDYLLQVSTNITSRNRSGDQKHNLLHEVLLMMYEKVKDKNEYLKSEDDFKRYATTYLKQYFTWMKNNKHNFKKDNNIFTYQPSYEDINVSNFYIEELEDNNAEKLIYIEAENVNDVTKLFLKDLQSNHISIDKGLMVNKIKDVAKQILDLAEYNLFDLYYLQEMDCLSIYKELKRTNNKPMAYLNILKKQKQIRKKIQENLKW